MPKVFAYQDNDIHCHHIRDERPNPQDFLMHAHEQMEIFYIISGKGSYLVEGTQYALKPYDIMIMRASETHTLLIDPSVPYERIALLFSTSILEAIDPKLRLLQPFMNRTLGQGNHYDADSPFGKRARAIFEHLAFENPSQIKNNLFARLLLLLTELYAAYENNNPIAQVDTSLSAQLVTYVNEHLFEHLSLQSVSDVFYRSKSQVSRLFRQATGSSFWEYVTIKRLLAARAGLQRGETALAVCSSCGFSDYSSFFRAYKSHFDCSPKEDIKASMLD